MNTLQNVIKNAVTVITISASICAVALIIEAGIFLYDWFHTSHSMKVSVPWGQNKEEVVAAGSITSYENIKKLKISCKTYDLYISVDSNIKEPTVAYQSNNGKVTVTEEDNTLYINQRRSYDLYSLFKKSKSIVHPGSIYLSLPKDFSFENCNLTLGSGETQIGALSCKELTLTSGNGKLTTTGMYADEATITTKKGSSNFKNTTIDNIALSTGSGKTQFSGNIYTNGDFKVGNGKFTLLLYTARDYYGISIKRGEGKIKIDGEDYENVPLSENGSHYISLQNQRGACDLIFQEQ